ncbi:heavy metal translocating P-type ATPase [Ruminococcaceae bacterium OttesenSCG-928-A16]|nr:heavy metal translocating P-type ATPase [Ruminococcaceae bacterium OttesenSCG-928-A16]
MRKEQFDVTGMTCSACAGHIEKDVAKLPGVKTVAVNLLQNSMAVTYDEATANTAGIVSAVEAAGYEAAPVVKGGTAPAAKKAVNPAVQEAENLKFRLISSIILLIPLMYISMGHMLGLPLPSFFHGTGNAMIFALTQFLLTLPVVYINRKFFTVGFKALFRRAPNMDSLIALGATAAMVYGVAALYAIGYGLGHGNTALVNQYTMDLYFESAATILTLITAGKYLEARSKRRTSDAIEKLLDLAPKTAVVLRNEAEVEVPVEEVVPGDVVVMRSGQAIPVDGVVLEGTAAVDEAALTGESLPVDKTPGDKVIGATINRSGYFTFKATKVGDDTTLAQIVELVREANSSKAPIAKLADTVSGIFVPVVLGIALVATVVWLLLGYPLSFALSIGIAVLVISCPCALGLATPTAIMVGTGKGAEQGILIKSAESLEIAHKVNTIVLDKTGTVTEGKPKVTGLVPAAGVTEEQLLSVAASVEKMSEHPLARAIVEEAQRQNLPLLPATNLQATAGRGVAAQVGEGTIYAGNLQMMTELGVNTDDFVPQTEALAQQGKTPLYFASGSKMLGVIALADVAKPTSKAAIAELKAMGIEVVMLTGDNARTAEVIRREMNIDRVVAEVLPQDKEAEVRRIQQQGKKVAMIGDGINDAPALARADVGIAIGAGTDVAIESADIVLMRSDLQDAVTAIQLSRAVIRNIKQNLFWAFFYNAAGIPLAAGVFFGLLGWRLNPMFAAAAMSLSSVCVVLNALRLKFFKPRSHAGKNTVAAQVATPAPVSIPIKKENVQMKKTITIEGMTCGHCSGRVEQALNALEGVEAKVDLDAKTAEVTLQADVADDVLRKAVEEAGYQVISIA